jgi:hypothetical protein
MIDTPSFRGLAMHSARTLLVALALAGCYKDNPNFCDNAPLDNCTLLDGGPDMSTSCSDDQQCVNVDNAHVCDTASGNCVQCTPARPGACIEGTPVCDDGTLKCVGCVTHADCVTPGSSSTSETCLPTGACAAEGEVAYVSSGGTDDQCLHATPCNTLAKALATGRPVIKFVGSGPISAAAVTSINRSTPITIVGDDGATIDVGVDNQSIIDVNGGSTDVAIHGIKITGTSGLLNSAHGIQLSGGKLRLVGCSVTGNAGGLGILMLGGTLEMTRSTVSNNARGGLDISAGSFKISNNFFYDNGNSIVATATQFGGVRLTGNATDVFEFNTVAFNRSDDGAGSGIVCNGSQFTLRNNIVWSNDDLAGDAVQIDVNNCVVKFNIEGPDAGAPMNVNMDPAFVNENGRDLRIQATSPARALADPATPFPANADTSADFQGDPRPVPVGGPADVGADEIP